MKIKAMIFAAGLGTRLYPLTANRPKAMVRMNGIPLLQHVLDKIIASGIDNIVVNVHHFPDQIMDFIKGHPFQADIRISDERAYLRDTAGGLKFAEPFLDGCDAILLYNTDIITTLSIPDLIVHHEKSGADVTLAVRKRNTQRYFVFEEEDLRLCGWRNHANGQEIMPRNANHPVELAFSGIHLVNRDFLSHIPTVEMLSLTPLYLQLVNNLCIKGYQHNSDDWMDIGKYKEYSNILS